MKTERNSEADIFQTKRVLEQVFNACGMGDDESAQKATEYLYEIASTAADSYMASLPPHGQDAFENELSSATEYHNIIDLLESHLPVEKVDEYLGKAAEEVLGELFIKLSPVLTKSQVDQISKLLKGDSNDQ